MLNTTKVIIIIIIIIIERRDFGLTRWDWKRDLTIIIIIINKVLIKVTLNMNTHHIINSVKPWRAIASLQYYDQLFSRQPGGRFQSRLRVTDGGIYLMYLSLAGRNIISELGDGWRLNYNDVFSDNNQWLWEYLCDQCKFMANVT